MFLVGRCSSNLRWVDTVQSHFGTTRERVALRREILSFNFKIDFPMSQKIYIIYHSVFICQTITCVIDSHFFD